MAFGNEEEAKKCLAHISYFRLKYYWTDMRDEETEHDFKEGSLFDDVIARYNFDRNLRLILFDAIEIIEVALRAKIINHLSQAKDSGLWYLDASLFERKDYYEDFVLDLMYEFDRSTEPFAKEYIAEHPSWERESMEGDNPDAWMILEVATFGTLSKMYKNLKSQLPERAAIANDFGLYSAKELSSWLEAISVLRNIIAHHSRLWNRSLAKQVTNPKGHRDKWLLNPLTDNQKKKPFGVISVMLYLCNAVYPDNQIKDKLLALIDHSPNIPYYKYGFVGDWRKEPIWR
jgi:abortive infection bacteriophage resistance protein